MRWKNIGPRTNYLDVRSNDGQDGCTLFARHFVGPYVESGRLLQASARCKENMKSNSKKELD
jgi:hypothetical protein